MKKEDNIWLHKKDSIYSCFHEKILWKWNWKILIKNGATRAKIFKMCFHTKWRRRDDRDEMTKFIYIYYYYTIKQKQERRRRKKWEKVSKGTSKLNKQKIPQNYYYILLLRVLLWKKLDSLKFFGPTMFDFEDIFTDISEVSSKIYEIQTYYVVQKV